ncbi:ATP-binding cassette domain-containing protein [Streptomyces sp. NPDC005813]|uniref:ABC transporter ATP-binding protein n=1 Tax=Streptomyces sp. NPDC005813 TaxID=3155592 RepID=UPI0033E9E898
MRDDLRLAGVGRRYGLRGPWVLRGVDLALAPGTLVRVEGANGTGKSTLLRLLAGIDAPTEGRITGRPRTAYVPERFPAALPFTASGYLRHLGAVHGLSRTAAARAADEWLERLGAAGYARTPMAELSKGSSQKVAVAQALLAEPDLLVLDEAWTGLDAAARAELERAVAERTAAGGAVVFVDHDPRRLAGVPDATYTLTGGALRRRTDPKAGGTVAGPRVLVEAQGPPDEEPPAEATALSVVTRRTGPGTICFTVPASHSDVLLRALLGARPPWHVVSVGAALRESAPHPETAPESAGVPDGPCEGAALRHDSSEGAEVPDAPSEGAALRHDPAKGAALPLHVPRESESRR